ncbi:DUF1559 domain-containing protein [Bremerella sp. JC770]|uniref:DUF1559 family PulG-like putative transporter n=1 Tax=Bremerella sp. JC770 TaxID=3232137 RepID=UPI003458480E
MTAGEWKFLWRTIVVVAMIMPIGGLFLPSLGTSRVSVWRDEGQNDLKHVGLAILNYSAEDVFQFLPPVAIVDSNGTPLLSWRVLMLPKLEETALFNQFDLSKPWNSPENLPLTEKIPDVYASPRITKYDQQGLTPYKAIIVENGPWKTAWGKAGKRIQPGHFKDGMSNTILVVEDIFDPVIWTKPKDISPDQIKQAID